MGKRNDETSSAAEIQVFELTMDNTEDQDELNRRLQKPGERYSAAETQSFTCEVLPASHPEIQARERERQQRLQKENAPEKEAPPTAE